MIDLLGSLAVSLMALCYALEARGPGYTFGFSASCLASAAYAVGIGSWPFAVVETLWACVALHKGLLRVHEIDSKPLT